MPIDTEVALSRFVLRRAEHDGKQTDNASLPAGAMMRFYCRHCCKLTETLPETFRRAPKTLCMPCEVLEMHGLIEEGMARYEKENG